LYFGTKFNESQDEAESSSLIEDYRRFCRNEYEIPKCEWLRIFPKAERRMHYYLDQNFLLEWLVDKKRISGKEKNRMQKLIGRLNRYLHPHVEYFEILDRIHRTAPL
jgi:hypothetical protein